MIGEIAKRHNLLLRDDDPLFVLLTLNDLALDRFVQRIEAAAESAQDQLSAVAVQQREAAKAMAELVVANGVEALVRANRVAFAEIRTEIKSAMAGELAAIKRAGAEVETARSSAWWAAAVAAGALCLMLGAAAAAWLNSGDRIDAAPNPASTQTDAG
jgi:hypothetical protein